jgi:alkylation response protein AidB-like acyl-CoA dehydrogenase
MDLVLSEDQELLAKIAADFVKEKSPVARFRELRDRNDAAGFSRELWKEMAALGWVGIPFDEAHGGAGLGLAELVVVLEELGRTLAPEPFLSTVLLGGQALARGGNEALATEWLPRIAAGDALVTVAQQEARSRYHLTRVETRAEATGSGYRISGRKIQVPDGHVADGFIVSARTSGASDDAEGVSLFFVPAGAKGLEVTRQSRVDHRGAALVQLDGVEVDGASLLGAVGACGGLLADVVDRATVGLCAEMLGGMQQAFDLTLDHLKSRKQFDVPIGSFQALKHRAADVFIAIELSKSVVMAAARAIDEDSEEAPKLVSLAKAQCTEAYLLAADEGVQMFGGVGMTDEYDIGFYLKRARAAELTFGDAAFHRDRWARLSSY